ncbi:taperin [Gouania willdenowi]|uniref:Taperin n=1 Tax=Gouania willdenowi TaxID=441366 RepID=A0A8C5ELW7_GOUWI|nr:taperin [Gouania willdenowi]
MSAGGEVRVLGQESPRMPAWKREILERRKAKGGGSGAPERLNGEGTGTGAGAVNGSGGGASGLSGRNYSISPAGQQYGNKEQRPAVAERTTPGESLALQESLVLQESLGPLEENPFIKLEKERRRRQDRENGSRPGQHILELYGSVPGIRTIRADNIIIIESDPDYLQEGGRVKSPQLNGVSGYSSLNDLLDRRGSAVTEIRAKEVVIYDTTLSKSEENLSTLGRPGPEDPRDALEGQGRVSRILQKFDSKYGKLQKKSHSTENLLDLDSTSSRPRLWSKPQADLVPKARPGSSLGSPGSWQPTSPVFHSPWSSKPKPQPAESELGSPQFVSSFRQRFETPRDEPDRVSAEVPPKPKVPCSPETPTSPITSKMVRSSPDFEIRPSSKPDLTLIPDGDTQALALANLRLQSKNSFIVIPKRRLAASPSSPLPPGPIKSSSAHRGAEVPTPGVPIPQTLPTPPIPSTPTTPPISKDQEAQVEKSVKPEEPPTVSTPPSTPAVPPTSPDPPPSSSPPPADQLPVTNIDEVEVEPPQRVPVPSPVVHRRKGNTFTVVPKRRVDPEGSPEPPQDALSEAPPGSTPPQAPYSQLGTLLKKRYPAAEDIQVVGGYLSLDKSCLAKTGSGGKKLNISFNESSLHSTYEYPCESSVWDSEDEEEDKVRKLDDQQPSIVGRIHIPRPSLSTSSNNHSSNGTDLSNYVPKHTVDFNTWQELKRDENVYKKEEEEEEQRPTMTEEVMLTPADSSSHSDYSSEPALYF